MNSKISLKKLTDASKREGFSINDKINLYRLEQKKLHENNEKKKQNAILNIENKNSNIISNLHSINNHICNDIDSMNYVYEKNIIDIELFENNIEKINLKIENYKKESKKDIDEIIKQSVLYISSENDNYNKNINKIKFEFDKKSYNKTELFKKKLLTAIEDKKLSNELQKKQLQMEVKEKIAIKKKELEDKIAIMKKELQDKIETLHLDFDNIDQQLSDSLNNDINSYDNQILEYKKIIEDEKFKKLQKINIIKETNLYKNKIDETDKIKKINDNLIFQLDIIDNNKISYLSDIDKLKKINSDIEIKKKLALDKKKHNNDIINEMTRKNTINILIRNSYRPNYFLKCIDSILNQNIDKEKIKIYICYDDIRCLEYLNNYSKYENITLFSVDYIDCNQPFFYNLYCNELLDKVENGWIIFMDDDNEFTSSNSLQIIYNNIIQANSNNILIWKIKINENIIIFPNNIDLLKKGDIDTNGICFNVVNKNKSRWVSQQGSDYIFYNKLIKTSYKNSDCIYISEVLTQTINENNGLKGLSENPDFTELINKHFIKQIYISDSLSHLKKRILFQNNLCEYNKNNNNVPSCFFGLYTDDDYKNISNHNGIKYIIFGGSDIDNLALLKKILKLDDIILISISDNITSRLKKYKIDSIQILFNIVDYQLFKPITEYGDKIFIYNGVKKKHDNGDIYGKKYYDKVVENLPDYDFIFSEELNLEYEMMPHIYKQCFIGLRLTHGDGNANMVQEMEAMNIPVIHNHSEYGIKWKTLDDIVSIIKSRIKN